MELNDTKYKIKCEMGACNNRASKTIKFNRVGIGSRLHVCDKCLSELYNLIGATLVPKSIETAKKKEKRQ
ncbi:MAG: hypothetical protein HFK08_03820 [Clostridia bacterium]|jgi:hypothetical protein|nr:hypothetical protein [Clostridia bacterium]